MLKNVTRNQKIAIGAGLLVVIVAILVIIGIASCQDEGKEVATGSDALGKALEQLASANEELSAAESEYASASEDLSEKQSEYAKAEEAASQAESEVAAAKEEQSAAEDALAAAEEVLQNVDPEDTEAVEAAKQAVEEAKTAVKQAQDKVTAKTEEAETAKQVAEQAAEAVTQAQQVVEEASESVTQAQEKVEEATSAVQVAVEETASTATRPTTKVEETTKDSETTTPETTTKAPETTTKTPETTTKTPETTTGHTHTYELVSLGNQTVTDVFGYTYTAKCYTYTCTKCGESKSAADHTHKYALLCESGYDDLYCYWCVDCDADFIDAPHTHDYRLIESCNVSCTKDGYRKYQCEECGDSYTTDRTPALGHVLVEIDRDGPDSTGKSENVQRVAICVKSWNIYYSCTRCGEEVAVEQEPLFPDGHPDYEDCPEAYYTKVYENIKFDATRLVCGKCGFFFEDPYENTTMNIFGHGNTEHGGSNWISKTVTLARRETGYYLMCRYCNNPYTDLYNFYGGVNPVREPEKYLPDWFVQKYFGHVYYGSIAGEAYWLKYVETGLSGTAEDNPGDNTYPDWVKENGGNSSGSSSSSFKNLSAVLFGDVLCPVVKGTRAGTVLMY